MDRRTIMLLGALTASVALVVTAALLLRGGESDRAALAERRAAGSGDGWVSSLGVRMAAIDPARPRAAGLTGIKPREAWVKFNRPVAELETTRTDQADEPTPPQAPMIPDAAAIAAGEAYVAAMPAVKQQVQAAIEGQKSAIRAACWTGEVPASASFPLEVSFDAEGQLLALSIGDDREAPGIGRCVREQPLQLDVDAPGLPITVQATIDLP